MKENLFPRATYRLQLNANFNFEDVTRIIGHLQGLGISHLYLSPCLQATSGSTHGYDVVNHNRISSELGKKVDFTLLHHRLEEVDMGIILDIVPNHMAISGPENPWWWDVLENGPASQYSRYFDVDWHSDTEDRSNLILMPVLGNHYGIVLENNELQLKHVAGRFTINYYEHVFPVAPRSLPIILGLAYQKSLCAQLGYMAGAFESLPHASSREVEKIVQRQRDKAVLEGLLQEMCRQKNIKDAIDEAVDEINRNVDLLDSLIGRQSYKLAFWKLSKYQIGYRRFFNINSLVGLRMEDEQVFSDSHRLVINLAKEGLIQGFRVDHPDGLFDPTGYFARLRKTCPEALIYAEKILESDEKLCREWQISGTTGYDFLNLVNGLFIDKEGYEKLKTFWHRFSGVSSEYSELARDKKLKIINDLLGSEINRLASDLAMICENHRRYRDFAVAQLYQALAEVAANLPVYRTYIEPETGKISDEEREMLIAAVDCARDHRPDLGSYIFEFIVDILTCQLQGELESLFVRRFQQITGPVMAKSLEDTVFYIYNVLISANEVGGNPQKPCVSSKMFNRWCERISREWPMTMLASSTHDTKRSEDVRARINLLSEIPEQWFEAVTEWQKLNAKYKSKGMPDANTEYLFYQTLVGSWPISLERIGSFMQKAAREAKVNTCWFSPDLEFENALSSFIKNVLENKEFKNKFEQFLSPLIVGGYVNSLAQLTLKLTAPGIPDIYQGNEVFDLSLTDPDNRRPIDFSDISASLAEMEQMNLNEMLFRMNEGAVQAKLFVIKRLLNLRKEHSVFQEPDSFKAVEILGSWAENAVAFMRGENILVVIPRLVFQQDSRWGSTRIIFPEGTWKNVFTEAELKSGSNKFKDILRDFPVAVFQKE